MEKLLNFSIANFHPYTTSRKFLATYQNSIKIYIWCMLYAMNYKYYMHYDSCFMIPSLLHIYLSVLSGPLNLYFLPFYQYFFSKILRLIFFQSFNWFSRKNIWKIVSKIGLENKIDSKFNYIINWVQVLNYWLTYL